jgi:site-specific recombinase XerD
MNQELIALFVGDMLRRNLSPRSQEAYRQDLLKFAKWHGGEIKDATRQEINRYTLYLLTDLKYKVGSARRNLATLRAFFKYLRREEIRQGNPAEDVELPKAEQRKPKMLRVPEIVAILNVKRTNHHHIRDRAMIELLYGSGIRRAEIAGMTLDDVDFVQQTAMVLGKGNKRRLVPLTQASVSAMQVYLHVRPLSEDHAFFLSNRKEQLGLRQVWKIVKDYVTAAGYPKASTHWMRHSFATHYIEGDGDLSSLQRVLGHSQIGTTQVYVHSTVEQIRKQFNMASMRDKPDFGK